MHLFLGIILGCALTIGGAYVADIAASTHMVNWHVVGKHMNDGWKKIAD